MSALRGDCELNLRYWGASEERGDAYYSDLSKLRYEKMLEARQIDKTMLALALRQPFGEVRADVERGQLDVARYRSEARGITENLVSTTQNIFEIYLEAYTHDQRVRGSFSGYLGELSFHLLLLRAANTRDVLAVPSRIVDDLTIDPKSSEKNTGIDSQVYTPTAGWENVQVKSDQKDPGLYAARIIQPPELPICYDGQLGLPLNIFRDFLDMQEGTASEDTIHAINCSAAALARSFE